MIRPAFALLAAALLTSASPQPAYDVVIRGGTIYDGSGGAPFVGDVALKGDRIVVIGKFSGNGAREVNARGLAVAPGFINMLSWSTDSLVQDGRSQGDIRQGVTLEVFGEGWSMGPFTPQMKADYEKRQGDIRYPVSWTTLGEYLTFLQKRGIAPNVASFVGATTVRIHELGEKDIDPTPEQLDRMRGLVRQAVNEGALGVGSSLIYAPANYAETPELIALATESAKCGGMYISHIRNESDDLLGAIDELIEIAKQSGGPAEIYHLKEAGAGNWGKLPAVIERVEAARKAGTRITADMYTYTAGATGLDAALPLWVQDGGLEAWIARLKDPAIRARVIAEMKQPGKGWENLRLQTGGDDKVLLLAFKNPALKPLTGKTLAEVAKMRGKSPEETAIDLVIEDGSRVGTAYFLMDEKNVARQTAIPWVAFGSDAESQAPEGVFLKSATHPRAYGNFARLLGKYVRDEKTTTLQDAVRRLTSFPATNLRLKDRGSLKAGYFADIVVFDPRTIADRATYDKPQVYATGMRDVFVNGVQVLKDGEHTGATPGRAVWGPGKGRCTG
ncbi:putative D-aminoacylase [Sphingomonas changbaiensis NBRC 104936]|uniref:Putative D-aminoacylase n=1 Tax=Sphingomonas changbaiensis NBRC 104936 TaxID=1219043 RepID=A0A0E9MPD2_9SPHN|nr:D-aminoacylase [Sphingomonas changbaiensis]GAO39632.1 putative D-aminoacylase [Sphingomonas changbaiensis NBRC 104936]